MGTIDDLNREVTSAIRFAECLEEVGSDYAKTAYLLVSFAEHRLANELTPDTLEWKIAWRGAIRAAVKAGDIGRAKALIVHLNFNLGITLEFDSELKAMLPQ